MGLIDRVIGMVFGDGRNAVVQTVELFRENAEAGAARGAEIQGHAMAQMGAEFRTHGRSRFDVLMDAINRLPRPALALGTLGLFVAAMIDPLWFAERMQGIALVPEPLWWLLGAIVSFYFGARHQVKTQGFQREIAKTMSYVPQAMANVAAIRALRADSPGMAETAPDAALSLAVMSPGDNPALADWRRNRVKAA